MGVIQFALWQHAEHIASAVAQQGVAVARLQGETAAAGQDQAQSVLDQLGSSVLVDSNITATRTAATTTVTVTGHAESIVGILQLAGQSGRHRADRGVHQQPRSSAMTVPRL